MVVKVSGMIVGDFPHDNKWYLCVFGSTLGGFLSSVLRGASGPPALRDFDPPLKRRLSDQTMGVSPIRIVACGSIFET